MLRLSQRVTPMSVFIPLLGHRYELTLSLTVSSVSRLH
jgi:hypothetical protein